MIDPVLFSFKLFNFQVQLTWYGLIVMSGVLIGAWFAEREVRRRGENGECPSWKTRKFFTTEGTKFTEKNKGESL